MPAYKDEKTGTWFVKFYVKDWTGANKQVKKRGFATKREALEYERSYKVRQESNRDMTFENREFRFLKNSYRNMDAHVY